MGRSAGTRREAGVGQFDKHPAAVRFNNQELFGDWGQTTHFMPQLLLNSRDERMRLTASCEKENYACILHSKETIEAAIN